MLSEFQVGYITKPHGLRGEVKVYTTSDDPDRFETLSYVILRGRGYDRRVKIERVRYVGDKTVLKLEGIDDVETAAQTVGCDLMVPREEALELEENEYYIGDLIGCRVFLEDGSLFGVLTDVLPTGANDVYEVCMEDGKKVLLPAIRECILDVQPEEERIVIHLMKGLL
ncbi:MAG: 16S rRNA processing protein RimM [Lachnospiraceae bacterium]|nr:16S rRNA processing protein RimM [Lachnospiraceae bacterium]